MNVSTRPQTTAIRKRVSVQTHPEVIRAPVKPDIQATVIHASVCGHMLQSYGYSIAPISALIRIAKSLKL